MTETISMSLVDTIVKDRKSSVHSDLAMTERSQGTQCRKKMFRRTCGALKILDVPDESEVRTPWFFRPYPRPFIVINYKTSV